MSDPLPHCQTHPRYTGTHTPNSLCGTCWVLYYRLHRLVAR